MKTTHYQSREETCLMLFTIEISLLLLPSCLRISVKSENESHHYKLFILKVRSFSFPLFGFSCGKQIFSKRWVIQDWRPTLEVWSCFWAELRQCWALISFSALFYDTGFPVPFGSWTGGRACKTRKWIYNDSHAAATASDYRLQYHWQHAWVVAA